MMSDAHEPTLRDVMDRLGRIDGRLDSIDGRLDSIDGRLDSVDGRLDSVDGRLDSVDGRLDSVDGRLDSVDGRLDENGEQVRKLRDRMDELEQGVANVLRDGFARVEAAVRGFAETKADRPELAALRADVDALKEAAG